MSELSQQITEDMKTAMREKNTLALGTIRMLKSAIKNAAIEKGGADAELSDAEVITVIRRKVKKRQDSTEQYTTVFPMKATAKMDVRLVPDQSLDEFYEKLRAHLDERGFEDVEMRVSGGYDPTETPEDSRIIRAELATYERAGVKAIVNPRLAGSWPGAVFTAPPLSLPAGHFGLGHGSGAHAPDEFCLIDSKNPKLHGMDDMVRSCVDYLFAVAD